MTRRRSVPERQPVRRVVFLPRWHDNPYQELLADGLSGLGVHVDHEPGRVAFLGTVLAGGLPDVVHVHTPDVYVAYRRTRVAAAIALGLVALQLALLRLLRVAIVWTVHDLENHERRYPRLDRLCRRLSARLAHRLIAHCTEAARQIADALGIDPAKIRVVPHGSYRDRYPDDSETRHAARAALGLPADAFVVLFLGNLRAHKGLESLLDAHDRLDRDTLLVIAGQPFDATIGDDIARQVRNRRNVVLRPEFVPDAMVVRYLRAANLVACPFTRSLTSGSLMLALTFGKAVVAPRLGCAAAMVSADDGLLYDPDDGDGLLEALRRAVDDRDRLDAVGVRHAAHVQRFDWPAIARATLAVYDECIG